MEWLKDKKNQPVVAAILAVVIVGAGVVVYLTMFRGPGGEEAAEAPPAETAVAPGEMMPGTTPEMSGTATTTATTPAPSQAAAKDQSVSATPMETWRSDPFLPIGYKPPKVGPKPKPRITDFPFIKLPVKLPGDGGKKKEIPEPPQPIRRMAGVLLNNRVYAIIETNGLSEIVQPGDTLSDRLAKVERIEPDKVILKTTAEKPRYLTVRMAASPKAATPSLTSPDVGPGPGPGPMYPYGRPPRPPGPMPQGAPM